MAGEFCARDNALESLFVLFPQALQSAGERHETMVPAVRVPGRRDARRAAVQAAGQAVAVRSAGRGTADTGLIAEGAGRNYS